MKKKILLPLITITLAFASCEVLNDLGIELPETSTIPAGLSQGEIIEGLKKLPKAIKTKPRRWDITDWPDLTKMEIFNND